jgi:hypothetical protein
MTEEAETLLPPEFRRPGGKIRPRGKQIPQAPPATYLDRLSEKGADSLAGSLGP